MENLKVLAVSGLVKVVKDGKSLWFTPQAWDEARHSDIDDLLFSASRTRHLTGELVHLPQSEVESMTVGEFRNLDTETSFSVEEAIWASEKEGRVWSNEDVIVKWDDEGFFEARVPCFFKGGELLGFARSPIDNFDEFKGVFVKK